MATRFWRLVSPFPLVAIAFFLGSLGAATPAATPASAQAITPITIPDRGQSGIFPVSPQAVPGGPYSGTVGVPVFFSGSLRTSFGFGITQFQWDFGDGGSGSGRNTSHVYSRAGTYPVTLTVTDPSGLSDSATTTATIQGSVVPIQVSADGPYSGALGTPVSFAGSVTGGPIGGILQFLWSFGDGTTGVGQVTTHIYRSAGTFPVTLTVSTTSGQTASAQSSASITQALQVSAGISVVGAAGRPVPFSATVTGATSPQFTWQFGDGTSGSGQVTSHVYNAPGNYRVTVTVLDLATGQQASDSISASISSALSVDANGPYSGVAGQPVALEATTSGVANPQYRWDFGDGTTGSTAAPTHTYQSAGTFTIGLTVTDPSTGQSASDTATALITAGGPVVSYAAGWNLVSGPAGTPFTQANSPLYTLRPGNSTYQVINGADGVQAGFGYWAYFNQPTTVTLSGTSTQSASVNVPAGEFVMVGNPSASSSVTIHGADYAISWDPQINQYKPVSSLAPGAGAWVFVAAGGAVSLTP